MPAASHAPLRIVQSRQNARVKQLRASLARPSARLIGLEGLHLVAEALRSGIEVQTLFLRAGEEALLDSPGLALEPVPEIVVLSPDLLRSALTTETPQPIAALAVPPAFSPSQLFAAGPGQLPLLAVLAGVQDPGNVGAILRSAEAFGATGVIALPGTASPFNPKTLRASMGSAFRLPCCALTREQAVTLLRAHRVRSFATIPSCGSANLNAATLDLSGSLALWIGSEGSGLSPADLEACDARVTIPCPGPVESLNAAVAAGVLLWEVSRQRAHLAAAAHRSA